MRYLLASVLVISASGCKRSDDRCEVGRKALIASLDARIAESDPRMKEILGFMKKSAEVHFDEVCASLDDEAKACVARFAEFDSALSAAPQPKECDAIPDSDPDSERSMQFMEMEPERRDAMTKACKDKVEARDAEIRGECNSSMLQLAEELSKREWADRKAAEGK